MWFLLSKPFYCLSSLREGKYFLSCACLNECSCREQRHEKNSEAAFGPQRERCPDCSIFAHIHSCHYTLLVYHPVKISLFEKVWNLVALTDIFFSSAFDCYKLIRSRALNSWTKISSQFLLKELARYLDKRCSQNCTLSPNKTEGFLAEEELVRKGVCSQVSSAVGCLFSSLLCCRTTDKVRNHFFIFLYPYFNCNRYKHLLITQACWDYKWQWCWESASHSFRGKTVSTASLGGAGGGECWGSNTSL